MKNAPVQDVFRQRYLSFKNKLSRNVKLFDFKLKYPRKFQWIRNLVLTWTKEIQWNLCFEYIQVPALTCWDDRNIYFHLVTSPRFFRLDFGSSSFSLNRQDAISPTMGVELCKAALAAAWFGQGFRCINKVPKTSTQKTHTMQGIGEKECPKDYVYTNDTVLLMNSEIQILYKSLLKGCFFLSPNWKTGITFKKFAMVFWTIQQLWESELATIGRPQDPWVTHWIHQIQSGQPINCGSANRVNSINAWI